jgi:LysM repeat protein
MLRLFILIFFCTCCINSFAASSDTLQVISKNDKWVIAHKVQKGETLFMLARRYHVPPAMLADANHINYQAALPVDSDIFIPLGAFNQLSSMPANASDARPLIYTTGEKDFLFRISRYAGVHQRVMQQWNNLQGNTVEPGTNLFVGWMLYDASMPAEMTETKPAPKQETTNVFVQKPVQQTETAKPAEQPGVKKLADGTIVIQMPKEVPPPDTLTVEEKAYMSETNNEQFLAKESGTAVFVDMKGTGKTKNFDFYYVFHSAARRGTIIKVFNPGTGQKVFAKVLGPIPNTRQYHNAIIGISSESKKQLGISTSENKAWCELSYAP